MKKQPLLKEIVYIVGIVICLNKRQEFLLVKRSKTDTIKPGFWEFPGGHIDPEDDSIASGAIRELLEEANLLCAPENVKLIGQQTIVRPTVEDPLVQAVIKRHYFLATEWKNEAKIIPNPITGVLEHDDLMWSTREEIKTIVNTTIPDYLLVKSLELTGYNTKND
tara:strand:+ start:3148 stop:3642 length:495 start_codon:yes stop_codon:yes gene_type:complete